MKILVNLSQLKSGGGQNVALNFLMGLDLVKIKNMELYFLVARNSMPHDYLIKRGCYTFYVLPRNPILRIFYESTLISLFVKIKKIDVVYTYFGFTFLTCGVKQICGSAESNIYFPEINFWESYRGLSRLAKRVVDMYRLWGVRRAYAVIYENKIMAERALKIFKVKNAKYIRPSIAVPTIYEKYIMPTRCPRDAVKVLFLCGWQLNKNIMKIPELAALAKCKSINLHIVLTAPHDGSESCRAFFDKIKKYKVEDMVSVVGPVGKSQLASLYAQIDIVALLSRLESFSNNIIEAWHFKRPLIVASEDWARSICNAAAFYVARNSLEDILNGIVYLSQNNNSRDDLIKNGLIELKKYPTIDGRIMEEFEYVRHIHENN